MQLPSSVLLVKERRRFGVGKVLITAAATWVGVGSYVFDWNETHIHNPNWPPHAKFHNAQTMSMGVALAGATWHQLWHRQRDPRAALNVAAGTASLYWLTQFSAGLYPGTASTDPPAPDNYPQAKFAVASLGIVSLGYLLERRRLA